MNAFRRHSAKGWLTAVALGALVLTGCGQEPSHRLEPAAAAEAAPSPTAGGATDDGRPHDGKKSAEGAESGKKAAPSAPSASSASSGRDDRKGPRTDADRKSDVSAAPSSAPEGRTATPAAPETTPEPAVGAPFAGTEQFVTISKAWSDNGRTYLSVRSARKKVNTRFDTWEVTPGTGPFTTVSMADSSRGLLAVPVREEVTGTSRAELLAYSPDRLVTLISRLDPALSGGIGYDLAFDGNGRVTGLASLYRP
ncbi:hypothetical protein ACIQU8_24230 [Streptomyces griseus]|uniref:hypothetical protein n=1 Tax=Streptomyces griseus TaxID=1911 RepID=UPI0038005B6C